jgi:hypothetical protein
MEGSTTKVEPAGDDWKNGAAEAASSNSAESVALSKDVISKSNSQSSPTAKTESVAPAHTSPRKRRKVNHGIYQNSLLVFSVPSRFPSLLFLID